MSRENEAGKAIDRQLGANVERVRIIRGMTKTGLGKALSSPISAQQIANYETGRDRIPSSNLVEIAFILRCRVADLVEGVEQLITGDNADFQELRLEAADIDMVKEIHDLDDPGMQAAVRNLCSALVKELAAKRKGLNP